MNRLAERANYFDTTVHPAKSQAEILETLEDFGSSNFQVIQGQANGQHAWMVRFEWRNQTYRFTFAPLKCERPTNERSFGGKRRTHQEQARWQMGRIAVHFVKAILTAAETNPDALFGFLELPEVASVGGLPRTAAEIDVSGLTRALPDLIVDGEIRYLTEGN